MTIDEVFRETLRQLLREELPPAIAHATGKSRLLDVDTLPVNRRRVLRAGKEGHLTLVRQGNFTGVDEVEYLTWLKSSGTARTMPKPQQPEPPQPTDKIDEIIAANARRIRKKKS